jgi:hypothetical protein
MEGTLGLIRQYTNITSAQGGAKRGENEVLEYRLV